MRNTPAWPGRAISRRPSIGSRRRSTVVHRRGSRRCKARTLFVRPGAVSWRRYWSRRPRRFAHCRTARSYTFLRPRRYTPLHVRPARDVAVGRRTRNGPHGWGSAIRRGVLARVRSIPTRDWRGGRSGLPVGRRAIDFRWPRNGPHGWGSLIRGNLPLRPRCIPT